MAEKILNTRIQLKYDSLQNWALHNPVLKEGEVAIAYLPPKGEGVAPAAVSEAVLMKVGPGNFNDLPYLSALAADIYPWAKAANAPDEYDTKYAFAIVEGKLQVTETPTTNGVAGTPVVTTYDFVTPDELTTILGDYYTKTEADAKFAVKGEDSYDDTELAGRVSAIEADYLKAADKYNDTQVKADIKANADAIDAIEADYLKAADIANFETKGNVKKVADDLSAYKNSNDTAVALKADKSVVDAMYTNGQIDTAVQGAKDYAKGLVDAIPAQTDYTVTITPANGNSETEYAKRYTFTQNGAEIGTIDLAKELVVTSGSVKEVETADAPYVGAKVGDKYIELVIANQDAPIYVPAKDLVDIYTAKDGATEVQVAISNTNEISATLVNGGVIEEKLAEGVKTKLNKTWEEVGVAQGLVDGLANGQVKTNTEAIAAKANSADVYTKTEVDTALDKKVNTADLATIAKTGNVNDLVQTTGDVLVFYCGNANTVI